MWDRVTLVEHFRGQRQIAGPRVHFGVLNGDHRILSLFVAKAISKDEGFSTAARLLTVFFGVVRQEGGWVCLRSVAQLVIVAALVLPMGFMASRKGRNAWRFHLLGCGLAFTQ